MKIHSTFDRIEFNPITVRISTCADFCVCHRSSARDVDADDSHTACSGDAHDVRERCVHAHHGLVHYEHGDADGHSHAHGHSHAQVHTSFFLLSV